MAETSGHHSIELDWDAVFSGNFPESPARNVWRDAVANVTAKAKAALPQCVGRIDAAVKIVLAGDVELLANGTARVASQSDGKTTYHVVNGDCTCKDFPRAPGHFCKHRLAYGIAKRAHALATQALKTTLDAPAPATTEPTWVDKAKQHPLLTGQAESPSIPSQFLTQIHGKDFVQYAGLLTMAHARGLVSLSAHFISVDESLALAEATAEFRDGTTFMECADATPSNVHVRVKPHFSRMALTRAKARALRDALNIPIAAVEEMDA
jgi:hypothetical protein